MSRFICVFCAADILLQPWRRAGAALQFNQTIQLRNTERKGQSFVDVLWKRIFCERRYLNLTATGAADTVAANCAAQGFSRGVTQNPDPMVVVFS
jgi:hypothetical protein